MFIDECDYMIENKKKAESGILKVEVLLIQIDMLVRTTYSGPTMPSQ